jgi:hypothetical protein
MEVKHMKRSRKTLFALLLALVMALGLTATAWAAEGNVTVNLPDGFIEQTPNVPMDPSDPVYKIHFTKVVEQAGTCAPGKETFKFEAVNDVIDAAEYPDVQRSVEIETNGAGTYQGTLTITGPAVQVQNFVGRGFYVREVQGNDQCWTYSNKEYHVAFDIDNTTREPMLTFYLNNEEVSEMTFTNIYTENLTAVEVPFTKTVKLGGHAGPGKTDFTIAVCDVNAHDLSHYTDVKYTTAVTTTGAGDYDGKLIISGPAGRVSEFVSEGFYVREVNDGLPKWTYSDAVWYVSPDGEIFPARMETTDNGDFYDAINNADAVGKMTFENIYTRSGSSHTTPDEKPTSSPKTFDAGMALYGVSALLSLTGTALVIKRKNG